MNEETKKNKEILKEIDLLDKQYCKNLKEIAKLQSNNILMKSKQRKLRTGIRIIRNIKAIKRLSKEEKEKIIQKVKKCEDCGRSENLTIHHKRKLSFGGTNNSNNLEVLCINCHRKRHPIDEIAIRNGEIKND